jgi:hypothetical protein
VEYDERVSTRMRCRCRAVRTHDEAERHQRVREGEDAEADLRLEQEDEGADPADGTVVGSALLLDKDVVNTLGCLGDGDGCALEVDRTGEGKGGCASERQGEPKDSSSSCDGQRTFSRGHRAPAEGGTGPEGPSMATSTRSASVPASFSRSRSPTTVDSDGSRVEGGPAAAAGAAAAGAAAAECGIMGGGRLSTALT